MDALLFTAVFLLVVIGIMLGAAMAYSLSGASLMFIFVFALVGILWAIAMIFKWGESLRHYAEPVSKDDQPGQLQARQPPLTLHSFDVPDQNERRDVSGR